MGAKTCLLVASGADVDVARVLRSTPPLDEAATLRLVAELFPSETLVRTGDADLTYTYPRDDDIIVAGCLPGVSIVVSNDFGLNNPSRVDPRFLRQFADQETVVLHAMHSVVDWFAFATWKQGQLVRALGVAPDNGVIEDIGAKLAFELPYWNGEHPAVDPEDEDDDYPLPFHPLEMGEAALQHFFGFQIEGFVEDTHPDPESVRLLQFRRQRSASRPWWKFW